MSGYTPLSAYVLAEVLACHQSWRHGATDTAMSPAMIDEGLNGAIEYLRNDPVRAAFVEALKASNKLFDEALPKFNWGASALDANAIMLLNSVPGKVASALRAAGVEL